MSAKEPSPPKPMPPYVWMPSAWTVDTQTFNATSTVWQFVVSDASCNCTAIVRSASAAAEKMRERAVKRLTPSAPFFEWTKDDHLIAACRDVIRALPVTEDKT